MYTIPLDVSTIEYYPLYMIVAKYIVEYADAAGLTDPDAVTQYILTALQWLA